MKTDEIIVDLLTQILSELKTINYRSDEAARVAQDRVEQSSSLMKIAEDMLKQNGFGGLNDGSK